MRARGSVLKPSKTTWHKRADIHLGIDLGQNAAMSAAAAYWPESGALDCFAVFPELPSLAERGLADGVGNRYQLMAARGELIQAGRRVSDVGALLDEARRRWGSPRVIACDRWREAELRQSLEAAAFPLTGLEVRGQGFKDGASDCRAFRAACLDGKVSPVKSLATPLGHGERSRCRRRCRELEVSERKLKAGGGRRLAMMRRRPRSWPWL